MMCHPDEPQAVSAKETYLPATLVAVRRCPARDDYLEMCFDADGKDWRWCFPEPMRRDSRRSRPLALIMTPVGVQARAFDRRVVGALVRSEVAIPAILAGAPTFLQESLAAVG